MNLAAFCAGVEMKFSLNFFNGGKYNNTIDELIIPYEEANKQGIVSFLDQHQHQRVVLDIKSEVDFDFLENIKIHYPDYNFAIRISKDDNTSFQKLQKTKLNFFNDVQCFNVEGARALAAQGVSDIYVYGDLCFNLNEVKKELKCNFRNIINFCQKTNIWCADVTSFFIRPEEIDFYASCIDYAEFLGKDFIEEQDIYKIYSKDKAYVGKIADIIKGFDQDIENDCISSVQFGGRRIDCRKVCGDDPSYCHLCQTNLDLANTLYAKGFTIQIKRN